jgi:hypothetical protein
VAHACHPRYSRGRDQEDQVHSQPGQKVNETPISTPPPTTKSWTLWHTPIMQEAYIGESLFRPAHAKTPDPIENISKEKELRVWLK